MIEAISKEDIVLASLQTMSGDKHLESGGMLIVQAWQGGKRLTMRVDKQADFFLPAEEEKEGMQLFYADDQGDWHLDEASPVTFIPGRRLSGISPLNNPDLRRIRCRFFMCRIRRAFTPLDGRFQVLNAGEGLGMIEEEMLEAYGVASMDELMEVLEEEQKYIEDLNFYAFQSNNLGWINCDRFMSFPQVQDVLCTLPVERSSNGYMVFDDITSVMNGSPSLDGLAFYNIPPDMEVKIVSFHIDDGQPMLSLQQERIGDEDIELEFHARTPQEMRREIQRFIN